MLDSDDCTLSLDNLFFERPVHKVKPLLCQEAGPWQLEAPPSLSQIPTTQDIQLEAESLSSLFGFSQKPKKFLPPLKKPADSFIFTSESTRSQSFNDERKHTESDCTVPVNLWGGEGFVDCFQASSQRVRGVNETLQDSGGHVAGRKRFLLDISQSLPLRRSLFRPPGGQVLNSGVDSSNSDNLSSQAAPRPQTYLCPVSMATEPPLPPPPAPSQPPPPMASPSAPPPPPSFPHRPPPFSFSSSSSLPCLGISAASGRPPQQQEMQTETPQDNKGTKRAHVLPLTPQPLSLQGSSGSGVLRPVSEVPVKFRSVFKEFPFFNYVQSKALDDVLYTGKNFVACAPTGSGKTVLFELAIIRLLMETPEPWRAVKAVYMAPIKALCSQRYEDWKQKFGPLGLSCKELTGDTEIDDFFEVQDAHIIMTTPEKWDSMTRKWKDNCLLQLVRLFLIDEVHVVKDLSRGATLEVVVSRMKAVHAYRTAENPQDGRLSMRFVAVSATIPNISDVAEWLCNESGPATSLELDESHRPVKLRKVVLGFPCSPNQNEFKFDLSLNYKMANVIQTYSDQKPTLVFCSTRKGVQQSAAVLAKDVRFTMSIEHKQRLMKYANSILDSKLRDLVMLGVGYHHAGVDVSDRKRVEEVFSLGDLPVLFTTSTLAMGVNLPAHLVVIKSTMHYVAGSCEEYSEADMLQMIGRAGRPQFDTSATAVIMTKSHNKDKYMKLINGVEIIESSLHSHLVEHLNAEIVLQTISDVNMALDWIRSTFLYIRALKNPKHYGFSTDLDRHGIEAKLQELCLKNLNSLASINLITMDEDVNIKPTEAGRLMARYCVFFETMKQFSHVTGSETLAELIEMVSRGKEFSDVQLRMNEKRTLNTLNKDKNRVTIRYPMEGKIKNNEMKVNCLIQAQLGSIPIQEFGLTQDSARIFRNGTRISRCLAELLSQRSKTGFSALLNALILAKCLRAKLWENSAYVSKQLEKIGLTLSSAMVNAGLTTFSKIEQINARELELIVNRHPPFGNQIRESVIHLPKYEVTLEQLPRYSSTTAEMVVTVNLKNQEHLLIRRTAPDYHYVTLLLGDSDNTVVFQHKLSDLVLLKSGVWSKKIEVVKASKGDDISVNLISSEYVGLDIQQQFSVFYSRVRSFGSGPVEPPHHTEWRVLKLPYNHSNQKPQRAQPSTAQKPQGAGQRAQPSIAQQTQHTPQTALQRGNTTPAEDQDPDWCQPDPGKRQCNHACRSKDLCGHDCCKTGVVVVTKRPVSHDSSFSSYLHDLRSRSDLLMETPVKRLKMKMSGESVSVNIQEFAYKPKEKLSTICRYGESQYEAVRPQIVDLTVEDYSTPRQTAYQEVLDNDYNDYMEGLYEVMLEEETAPPPAPQVQSSSMWRKPGVGVGGSVISRPPLHQSNRTNSSHPNISRPETGQGNANSCVSSSLTPSVTFDIGSEWDDWDDFDDENLVHASEMSTSICVPKTRFQQPVHYSPPEGYTTKPAPLPPIHNQPQPRFTMTSTPIGVASRSVPPSISPELRYMGSPLLSITPHNRLTTPRNHTHNKRQNNVIFSEEIAAQPPQLLQKLTETSREAPLAGRFDFFSNRSAPNNDNMSGKSRLQPDSSSKEEEAFIGIFDGIF